MRKAIATVAAAAMLACTLGLAACSGSGSAGESEGSTEESTEEEDYVGDGVSGVVEADGVYYTDLVDEEGYAESLEVTLDTVIVPVEASGNAIDSYTVELQNYGDDTAEWSYVQVEVDDEDGFTLGELLSEGTVYYDQLYDEEWDGAEYEGPEVVDVDIELSADDELMIYWGDNGSSIDVVLTEDDLEYSSVEVDLAW